MSLSERFYVASNPPMGAQNKKRHFSEQNRPLFEESLLQSFFV